MRSSNPVFSRSEEFNRGANPYGDTYTDPSQWGTGGPVAPATPTRMTIDSVVQKTAFALGTVIVTAALTWYFTPEVSPEALGTIYTLAMVGAGAAFILSMVNSFKKVVSPALVLAFCAVEGVALGAISKAFEGMFNAPGLVQNAVIGTFAAFAGTLAAYKILDIKVGDKFRKFTIAAMFGMVGLGLFSLVASLFGFQTGLFGFGALGLLTAVAGLVIGVFMLILDFDFVEKGVAAGIPERESWRAAFGLTVSLVWIYINLLRILAIFSQD